MTESSAQKPVKQLRAGRLMAAVKVLCAAIAVSLTSLCLWIFRVFTPLALDYPFRRAGESAEFPPLGTLPFYMGCATALLGMILMWIIALVIALVLAFTFKVFTASSWRSRFLASMAMLVLCMTISASYDIHRQTQWYRAHPTALHPRHPKLEP